MRRCFSFHPLLIGGNTFDAPSLYVLIHYLGREWGIHYALGGTGSIVDGFGKLLGELGVKMHTEVEVREILVEDKHVRGVRLGDGTRVAADAVVSNADVAWTYLNLLPPESRSVNTDKRTKRYKYSMSLFVIYFGARKRYNDTKLAHHNIILSERYKGLLSDIFNAELLPPDFSLYLHVPTLTDPSMAPEGREAFYVLARAPHGRGN